MSLSCNSQIIRVSIGILILFLASTSIMDGIKSIESVQSQNVLMTLKHEKWTVYEVVPQSMINSRSDTSDYLTLWGNKLTLDDALETSSLLYKEAVHIDNTNGIPWYRLSLVQTDLVLPAQSRLSLEKSLQLDTDNRDAWFDIGKLHEQEGNSVQAIQSYKAGLIASHGKSGDSDFHLRLGHLTLLYDIERAWRHFDNAIQKADFADNGTKRSSLASAYYGQLLILLQQNNVNKSIELCKLLLNQFENHYFSYISCADASEINGDYSVAISILENAINRFPKRKNAYYLLARFHESHENIEPAINIYESLLAIYPDDEQALHKISILHNN